MRHCLIINRCHYLITFCLVTTVPFRLTWEIAGLSLVSYTSLPCINCRTEIAGLSLVYYTSLPCLNCRTEIAGLSRVSYTALLCGNCRTEMLDLSRVSYTTLPYRNSRIEIADYLSNAIFEIEIFFIAFSSRKEIIYQTQAYTYNTSTASEGRREKLNEVKWIRPTTQTTTYTPITKQLREFPN